MQWNFLYCQGELTFNSNWYLVILWTGFKR